MHGNPFRHSSNGLLNVCQQGITITSTKLNLLSMAAIDTNSTEISRTCNRKWHLHTDRAVCFCSNVTPSRLPPKYLLLCYLVVNLIEITLSVIPIPSSSLHFCESWWDMYTICKQTLCYYSYGAKKISFMCHTRYIKYIIYLYIERYVFSLGTTGGCKTTGGFATTSGS